MNDGLEQGVAKLESCPFCGGTTFDTTMFRGLLDSVGCAGCGAVMLRTDKNGDPGVRWNTRAAIPPVKAQGEATGAGWRMVPAEPTPKMLFEADKILAGEPRILSALYRAMIGAALPPVAGAAGTVGEPVSDAVWEALQRLIENAASLGPSSQEDAMVVARWRGQFVAARERATLPPTPPAAGTVPIEAGGGVAIASVDLTRPHWRCVCGALAMPLTDDTRCQCKDEYDNAWTRVDPTRGVKASAVTAEMVDAAGRETYGDLWPDGVKEDGRG